MTANNKPVSDFDGPVRNRLVSQACAKVCDSILTWKECQTKKELIAAQKVGEKFNEVSFVFGLMKDGDFMRAHFRRAFYWVVWETALVDFNQGLSPCVDFSVGLKPEFRSLIKRSGVQQLISLIKPVAPKPLTEAQKADRAIRQKLASRAGVEREPSDSDLWDCCESLTNLLEAAFHERYGLIADTTEAEGLHNTDLLADFK